MPRGARASSRAYFARTFIARSRPSRVRNSSLCVHGRSLARPQLWSYGTTRMCRPAFRPRCLLPRVLSRAIRVRDTMKQIRKAVLLLAIVAAPAQADTVADWNRIALDAAARSGQPLEYNLRAVAMVHVAMFETLNFIQGGYEPHFIARSPEPLDGMSIEAAAAAAAYHVLVELYPFQRPAFAATLKNSVHAFPGSQATANGV